LCVSWRRRVVPAEGSISRRNRDLNRKRRCERWEGYPERGILSVFSGVIDLHTNTPNTKGPTRAQVAQYGDNYLLSNDPTMANYYGYNFYHVATDFEYVGLKADVGHGWNLDNKVYTYRYWNQQNYNGTTISATSATDKLNGYRKVGDLVQASQTSRWGTFRTGMWYEYAWTNRFQIPSDPRTWKDAVLPNFHEKFNTTTVEPYAEYEFRVTRRLTITPGVKFGYYKMDLTQYPDNGKTVGNLGGLPFVQHTAVYHAWQPSFDANYRLTQNWSVYGQYATGNVIPPSSVFDVKNAAVAVLPKPTQAKTYQGGTVLKFNRVILDADVYHTHFENQYSTTPDPVTGEPVYYATGASVSKGVEAESTILVGWGFSVYANGTAGSARYVNTQLWVQNAPRNTETIGLTYMHKNWDVGFFDKRVGQMWNDNGSTNQAVLINPFSITNLFFNYTIRSESRFKDSKIRLSINNLIDSHNIVGVAPASTTTSVPAPGDILTLLPGPSIMVSFTCGFSRRK
jgi:iron complex outermembrane receptor protein